MPRRFEKKKAVSFAVVRKLATEGDQVAFQLTRVGKEVSDVPDAIPERYLADDGEDDERFARKQDQRLKRLAKEAEDPHLLPHEYDYEAHMKTRGDGVFVASSHAPIDPENDARDVCGFLLTDRSHVLLSNLNSWMRANSLHQKSLLQREGRRSSS